nr:hypothetical protein [Tanacetum cinerariifolium]
MPQRTRSKDYGRNDDSHHCLYTRSNCRRFQKKATHRGNHKTNPSGTFQSGNLTFEVSQGKDGGLTGLPLTITPKEILAAEARKFKPPPSMVTPIEKRSSNKFCDFHNDKGPSTDECVQLKKQIKKLVRAGKLSHLIKEIKQGRDQLKLGKKEVRAKDKSMAIYMGNRRSACYRSGNWRAHDPPHVCRRRFLNGSTLRALLQLALAGNQEPNGPVPFTAHRMLKFPLDEGIVTIRSTILISAECAAEVTIEGTLSMKGRTGLCSILKENLDIFAWKPFDMTGVLRLVAELRLNIHEGYTLVRQKKGPGPKMCQSHPSKSTGTIRGRDHERSLLSRLAVQFDHEAEQAFKQLKQHLSELPMLVAPKPKEELIVYMSASRGAISAVPMTERDTVQTPVYFPRTSVKGQILADFLIEKPDEAPPDTSMANTPQESRTLFTDGSSCVDGSGAGIILTSPNGLEFTYALRFQFTASNNEAEYEALIAGLRIATQMGVCNVHKVDALSKIASTSFAHLSKHVLVEILKEKSIQENEVATVVEEDGPTWMTPIMEYLKDGTLSDDKNEASKLRIKARQYELLEGVLYRRSFLKPWLRNPQQPLTPITAPWPFYKWGIDIAGPFPKGPGKSGEEVRVGQHSVSLRPSERNSLGQWSLGEGIKACLGEGNKNWIEELPHVLWSHHTMIKSSHGDTPFSLTYRTEAVIPAEIKMSTYRTVVVNVVHNNEELRLNLDLLEERRERAAIREVKAKLKMTKYYNARVRGVTFRPGDFVYRSNDASHAVDRGSLAQSGKDFMRSWKHLETKPTG